MLELNKVLLVGNLTRDPELSYLASGTPLAKLGLAVGRRYKDKNGQYQEETAFIDIDAWSKTAEFCAKYLKKGGRIFVEGSLRYHQWDAQDGTKRSKLSVTAERVQFADSKRADAGEGGYAAPAGGPSAPAPNAAPRPAAARGGAPAGFPQPASQPVSSDNSDASGGWDEGANTADDLPF